MAANHRIGKLIMNGLRRGIEEGVVRDDIDPTDLAIIAWSSTTSLMFRIDTAIQTASCFRPCRRMKADASSSNKMLRPGHGEP